jgi:hypothetical protein
MMSRVEFSPCRHEASTPKGGAVKKLLVSIAAGAGVLLAAASLSLAGSKRTWTAALTAGQETPKQTVKTPAAHGQFKATLSGNTLKWRLTFAKLSGPATAAHIHMAARGKSGGVVVPLCGPCTGGQTGSTAVSRSVIAAFNKHELYVNVHTAKNPDGEIRGQILAG